MEAKAKENSIIILTENTQFTCICCCECGIPFYVPERIRKLWLDDKSRFFCPNGHGQSYTKSTSDIEIEKLKKELAFEKKEKDHYTDRYLETLTEKNKLEKAHKRLCKTGVCPCCQRNFVNVKRHMENKHPEYLQQ